jgi:hypothetical protein
MTSHASEPTGPAARLDVPRRPGRQDGVDRLAMGTPMDPPVANSIRVVETRQLYPGYVIPLTALTAAFLAVDLAFASRQLDAIGNPISGRQLTELASWGWVLSGVALTLLVWGSIILPRAYRSEWPVRRIAPALLLSALVCCETVYLVGPGLTGLLVDRMTAPERRCAVQLRVLATARQDSAAAAIPTGVQSALLRAPFAGLSCDGVPAVSRDGLAEALQGMVARRAGTAEQMYNNLFIPSVRSLRDAYNEYVAAQLRLVADIRAIPDQQSQAWQRYLDRVGHVGSAPTRIPRRDWPRIATEVRDMGVQVPPEWNPADQSTFMEAVATASRRTADASYNDFVMEHFQQALPPGLDWEGFCSQPTIQQRWRLLIDTPAETSLTPKMGFPAFRQTVYDPRVDRLVQPRLNDLLASPDGFAPDGSRGQAGRAAAYWAIAPALLFAVAVICILWHVGRLLDLVCCILLPRIRARKRWAAEGCVAAAVVILFVAWPPPHPATRNSASCSGSGGGCNGNIAAIMLWPIGSTMRNVILFGCDFGYDAASAGDLSETALEPLLPRVQPRL